MIAEYRYLVACLLGLVPLALVLIGAGRLRSTAMICGAVLAAYSPPVAWLYERVYWTPGRLLGGGWGVEDVLFCFHAGAVSWVCAMAPWRGSLSLSPSVRPALRRLTIVTVLAAALLMVLIAFGVGVVASFMLVQTASTVALLVARRSYARLLLSVIPTFLPYYFATLTIWRLLLPGFMGMWSGTELTGWNLLGVPIEEYVWVLSFCTGFPVTMAFAFDAGFTGKPASDPTPARA